MRELYSCSNQYLRSIGDDETLCIDVVWVGEIEESYVWKRKPAAAGKQGPAAAVAADMRTAPVWASLAAVNVLHVFEQGRTCHCCPRNLPDSSSRLLLLTSLQLAAG